MSETKVSKAIKDGLQTVVAAIELNTEVLERLVDFLTNAPEFQEVEWGSAEEDRIDDSLGVVDESEDAIKEFKKEWQEAGYPEDLEDFLSDRPGP